MSTPSKNEVIRQLVLLVLAKEGPKEDKKGGASAQLSQRIAFIANSYTTRVNEVIRQLENESWIGRERDPRVHRTYRIWLMPDKEGSTEIQDILGREAEIMAAAKNLKNT